MDDDTANHLLDRLCDNFTSRELLGMLTDDELKSLYKRGADIMEWED